MYLSYTWLSSLKMHQCHSSQMSGNNVPPHLSPLSVDTCSASSMTPLCCVCVSGRAMGATHLPCRSHPEGWLFTLQLWPWMGDAGRDILVRQDDRWMTGGSQLGQVSLQVPVLLYHLGSVTGNPTAVAAKYDFSSCAHHKISALIQTYSLAVETRKK